MTQDNASGEAPEGPRGKEALKAVAERLKRQEATEIPGAPSRELHSQMLDASPLEESDKDHHYRFVNLRDPKKVRLRQRLGYVAVSDEEAAKVGVDARLGGEAVLMRIPRAAHEARVEGFRKLGEDRLQAHKAEVQKAVENVVRELRDKHGIDIPMSRLFVKD